MTSLPYNSVFITGATGLVGSYIARRYLAGGHAVTALCRPEKGYGMLTDVADRITWYEGDVLDIPSLEAATLTGRNPGSMDVVHAAAVVSFVPKDRGRMERVNVEGTANVVNVCLRAGVRKLGYVSSVAALGRPLVKGATPGDAIVITENQKWEESPRNSAYAKTKYRAELEVWRGLAEGLNVVVVNPGVVLGAGDWSRSSLQLIRYAYDEPLFYPAGLVSYVDVLDVADTLYQLMQSGATADFDRSDEPTDRRFVLTGGTIPYRSLLEQMATALGKRPPTVRLPPVLARLLWPLAAGRSWLTGSVPRLTRETARSTASAYRYDGRKIEQVLDFQYRPLAETLRRVASTFGMSEGDS